VCSDAFTQEADRIHILFFIAGGPINFNDLSAEEKKHFQRAVASGELSKLVEPWDPWWLKSSARTVSLSKEGTRLVQPLTKEEASSSHDGAGYQPSEILPVPDTSCQETCF
jgi:hypothetical protein